MEENNHIISQDKTLVFALGRINDIKIAPLEIIVIEENERKVGT